MSTPDSSPSCKKLVLDAGPLLSLSPLRGLAETYLTVPQVLEELKDQRAREHFEKLGLSAGVKIEVKSPDAVSLAHVIQFSKKTGDYSVLSHADICILALTYALSRQDKEETDKKAAEKAENETLPVAPEETHKPDTLVDATSSLSLDNQLDSGPSASASAVPSISPGDDETPAENKDEQRGPLDVELQRVEDADSSPVAEDSPPTSQPAQSPEPADEPTIMSDSPLYDDPSDEDDGEGEWITPTNVALHKSKHLDLLPSSSAKGKAKETIGTGCMTADFAMQNVLLQMGLNLVGVEGKRIQRLKTWVLRCHACFKICKDNSKQFCPSCGNPTLLRTSVTIASPDAAADSPTMQIHLKKNFQYKLRGTKYSIPAPKPGSAKTGTGDGLVLREDQLEYMRAKKKLDAKRERDERKLVNGVLAKGAEGGVRVGSWMDPDWVPEMLTVGAGGKGRSSRNDGLPTIGYGRKNPNERRRKK